MEKRWTLGLFFLMVNFWLTSARSSLLSQAARNTISAHAGKLGGDIEQFDIENGFSPSRILKKRESYQPMDEVARGHQMFLEEEFAWRIKEKVEKLLSNRRFVAYLMKLRNKFQRAFTPISEWPHEMTCPHCKRKIVNTPPEGQWITPGPSKRPDGLPARRVTIRRIAPSENEMQDNLPPWLPGMSLPTSDRSPLEKVLNNLLPTPGTALLPRPLSRLSSIRQKISPLERVLSSLPGISRAFAPQPIDTVPLEDASSELPPNVWYEFQGVSDDVDSPSPLDVPLNKLPIPLDEMFPKYPKSPGTHRFQIAGSPSRERQSNRLPFSLEDILSNLPRLPGNARKIVIKMKEPESYLPPLLKSTLGPIMESSAPVFFDEIIDDENYE